MIVDRHAPADLFALVPRLQLTFEPELAALDRLLDDDLLFQQVKADLARRYPRSATRGRPSTPVEVILRMLVVRRLYDWSYAATEHFVSDSLVLRQFCRLYLEPAPDDTTLLRWAACLGPATLERVHARVVELARQRKVTRGRKLRTDGTVVETTIHYPTDSALLADGVRVLGRLVRRAKAVVAAAGPAGQVGAGLFRDRTRSAKRLARQIQETVRRRGAAAEAGRRATYQRLLQVAQASLRQAQRVQALLPAGAGGAGGAGGRAARGGHTAATRLVGALAHFLPLVQQVLTQTARRVLGGETVPAAEKLVSLFEPHTRVIRRGKVHLPAEFGRKVWLDEVDGGIVSRYAVLDGNPPEAHQVPASLGHHCRVFGRPPRVFAGDRGVHAPENERLAQAAGVAHVALPQPGARSPTRAAYERQRWFRRAHRFRAGVEGRISVCKRRGWLGRCRDHGEAGFVRWIGWGIITANLRTIARTTASRG
jgi:IS5 family transposase